MTEPAPTGKSGIPYGRPHRPHPTERAVSVITRLRLYRPVMRALHKIGQCWQTTRVLPSGRPARICTWCGARNGHPDDLANPHPPADAVRETNRQEQT